MDEILETITPNHVIVNLDLELHYFAYTFTAGYIMLLIYLVSKGLYVESPRNL